MDIEGRRHRVPAHWRPLSAWPAQVRGWTTQLSRERKAMLILIVAFALAAVVGLVTLLDRPGGVHSAAPPVPQAPSSATSAPAAPAESPTPPARSTPAQAPFHCSTTHVSGGSADPLRICIPAIRVDAAVLQLGLNSDRTVEVPPLSQVGDAGWYKYSVTPGSVGPTVILGHVDSAQYGEGVFFRLGRLHAGDQIVVTRDDGMVATYRVDQVSEIAKSRFPTDSVYGATSGPAIRLVTCGGKFDPAARSYLDNIIAYGTLLSLRQL